ncbi:hypothetical protein HDU96_001421, partial [Phlyctochytrium bullatum]
VGTGKLSGGAFIAYIRKFREHILKLANKHQCGTESWTRERFGPAELKLLFEYGLM